MVDLLLGWVGVSTPKLIEIYDSRCDQSKIAMLVIYDVYKLPKAKGHSTKGH